MERLLAASGALPVAEVLGELRAALGENRTAILVAPPGAGKTTVVPAALAGEPWTRCERGEQRSIVILEPRRLAARAAARRMADLLGERVGETVGYQTRDERAIGPTTRIEVLTEGILTRRLQRDPALAGTAAVIFDEVHERNLTTDLGLALTMHSRGLLRPDLRIVAMSATPDLAGLARVLPDATVLASDGRLHPVDIVWDPRRGKEPLELAIARVVARALHERSGDVLVFLPGIGEIRRAEAALAGTVGPEIDVLPLAGALSLAEQDAALAAAAPGRRRVVLSTDIAESSLTVPGVRIVVDAGLARTPRLDPSTGMTRLTTVSTSRASADQRAGRAGRTEPGACYRLWSKLEHTSRPAHLPAEITAVDLAGLVLELAAWGAEPGELTFADPPPPRHLRTAGELLGALGALDEQGRITPLGRRMSELPVHPRLARILVGAGRDPHRQACACAIAAVLDERDPVRGGPQGIPADLAIRVELLRGRRRGPEEVDTRAVVRIRDRAVDLARRVGWTIDLSQAESDAVGPLALLGFPDRLAVGRSTPGNFQLRGGTAAQLAPTDSLAGERFIVAVDLDGHRTRARVRLAAAVDADHVADAFADSVEVRVEVLRDPPRGELVERRQRRLNGMLLDETRHAPRAGAPETIEALVEHVRRHGLGALGADRDALRARVGAAARAEPDRWPEWDDRALVATLDEWLAPFLGQVCSLAELAALDPGMILGAQLGWDQHTRLTELAPRTLHTPAGREIPIDYDRGTPRAAVRVQDLFGCVEHPHAAGKPIVLELLSPADRPLQVTTDLPGFWTGSWAEVRREMAGRYPKHSWPEDPRQAPPRRLKRDP